MVYLKPKRMRWLLFFVIYIAIDIYAYQAIKTLTKSSYIAWIYGLISMTVLGLLVYQIAQMGSQRFHDPSRMYVFGFFISLLVPKLLLIIMMFGEDVFRFFEWIFSKLTVKNEAVTFTSRRKFISKIALGIAAIPFASLLYGMFQGKYNFKVLKYALEFDDLPEEFHNYTITQISDVHSGSFDNKNKIEYAINLINEQKSDAIMFTGDLVNNTADEMTPWKDIFGTLKAKDGVFSVLGNHDYGDYVSWENAQAKQQNLKQLENIQKEMGWDLLKNEHRLIQRGHSKIAIVGVENWGEGGFKKAGDLGLAGQGLSQSDFKILLSHDPSHWKSVVKKDAKNYQLTLSGHTHGMQFGIEIPGWIKWSPVKYRYENWAGIYESVGRYINVNRGFGYLGYPGRVGIWPEITVIQLKKRGNTA